MVCARFPVSSGGQEDVLEAMRSDAVDEITEQLEGTGLRHADSADKKDGDDERTRGSAAELCCMVPVLCS